MLGVGRGSCTCTCTSPSGWGTVCTVGWCSLTEFISSIMSFIETSTSTQSTKSFDSLDLENETYSCAGIYKVVKYWPAKGQSGFIVWRYLLRRDDPSPAPWTDEGIKRIEDEGFTLNYPEGYLEAQAEKEKDKKGKTPAKGKKRKKGESVEDEEDDDFLNDDEEDESASPAVKKTKTLVYKISKEWDDLMEQDKANANLWEQVKTKGVSNKKELTDYVEDIFCCIICQVIYFDYNCPNILFNLSYLI